MDAGGHESDRPARGRPRAGIVVVFGWISAAALFAMMILMTLDVIGRELLGRPLPGALELIELTLVVTVFAALPLASWREDHIVADIFDPVMSRKVGVFARAAGCLVGAAVFSAGLPHLWTLARRTVVFGDTTPQLGIPLSWAIFTIFGLCAVTAFAFALRALALLFGEIRPGRDASR